MVDAVMRQNLEKIGPGLGPRSKIWHVVLKKVQTKAKMGHLINDTESEQLVLLSKGMAWMEMIPAEFIDEHSMIFESKVHKTNVTERTLGNISRDVPRTFSLYIDNAKYLRLHFRDDMREYCDALEEVLVASSYQNYDKSYCQGMNFLAATFLLSECSTCSAFILMCNMLKRCHLAILYNAKCSSLMEYMEYFEQRLKEHNPRVYDHLSREGFPPLCYAVEWFTTCFLVSSPGELSSCVLDLMLLGFEDIMIRVGLALMDHLENLLIQSTSERLQLNFKKMLMLANCVEVMYRAVLIPCERHDGVCMLESMKNICLERGSEKDWINTLPLLKRNIALKAPLDNPQGPPLSSPTASTTKDTNSNTDETGSLDETIDPFVMRESISSIRASITSKNGVPVPVLEDSVASHSTIAFSPNSSAKSTSSSGSSRRRIFSFFRRRRSKTEAPTPLPHGSREDLPSNRYGDHLVSSAQTSPVNSHTINSNSRSTTPLPPPLPLSGDAVQPGSRSLPTSPVGTTTMIAPHASKGRHGPTTATEQLKRVSSRTASGIAAVGIDSPKNPSSPMEKFSAQVIDRVLSEGTPSPPPRHPEGSLAPLPPHPSGAPIKTERRVSNEALATGADRSMNTTLSDGKQSVALTIIEDYYS